MTRLIRRWLRMGPPRADLIAEAQVWRDRCEQRSAERDGAYVRAKAAEKRARQSEARIRELLEAGLNEPGRVDGCSKVRFHHQSEADGWADAISEGTGQPREAFNTYRCKICPRSPVTHKSYWHTGHGGSRQARKIKEDAQSARQASQAAARRAGMTVGQRVDPTILARLRRISDQG